MPLIGVSRFNANPTAAKPVTVGGSGGAWTLRDPAHDPAGFLTVPGNACWPLRDEPLRSSLPAIFDGGVMTCPNGVQDDRPVFLTGADGAGRRRRPGAGATDPRRAPDFPPRSGPAKPPRSTAVSAPLKRPVNPRARPVNGPSRPGFAKTSVPLHPAELKRAGP